MNKYIFQIICFTFVLAAWPTSYADAGPRGKIAGALADYDDYKARVIAILHHADTLRADHYSADTKDLLSLLQEVGDAQLEIHRLYNALHLEEIRAHSTYERSQILLAMQIGLAQLTNALSYEITYQSGQRLAWLLLARAKSEELFLLADHEVTAAKAAAATGP